MRDVGRQQKGDHYLYDLTGNFNNFLQLVPCTLTRVTEKVRRLNRGPVKLGHDESAQFEFSAVSKSREADGPSSLIFQFG